MRQAMTPVRAVLAGLFAAALFGAGLILVAGLSAARPHDLAPLLSSARTPFSIWCFLAAWGALIGAVLGVLAAFIAFIAPERDDDPRLRRHGFPKWIPIALILIALALAWFALRCTSNALQPPPISVPVAPDEPPELLGGEPPDEPLDEPPRPAPPPEPVAEAASFSWTYKDPLIRADGAVWLDQGGTAFADEAESARLLCGKAWVAVSGSASEEGPPERNAERARRRAQRAMARANSWLAARPECGATVVLGLDLGQHASTAPALDEGAATAYQRQILVVSRARAEAGEALDAEEALAELRAFLADPANRAALFAGRDFPAEPRPIAP